MVDTTQNHGFPYPEGGDQVAVHSDIERLAKHIDLTIGARLEPELVPGSVTPHHTSFFDISTNMFDKDAAILGYWYASGNPELLEDPDNNYYVSDWIPVTPGTEYSMGRTLRATFFDHSHQYVGTYNGSGYENHFTTPSNAAFLRITTHRNHIDALQLNLGDTLLPYEEYRTHIYPKYIPNFPEDVITPESNQILVDTDGLSTEFNAPTIEDQTGFINIKTDEVHAMYDALMTAHPDYVTRQDLGVSSDGLQHVYAYTFCPPKVPTETFSTDLPVALIISGTHGHEKTAVYHTWRLAQALCEEWDTSEVLDALRWNIEIVIVPVANPHGIDVAHRHNANGVDINRNYEVSWRSGTAGESTYGGTAPLSEPESQAINSLMEDIADRAVFGLDFHNFSTQVGRENEMIWCANSEESPLNDFTLNIGQRLITRMSRKWKKEHAWITETRPYFGYANKTNAGGTTGQQMAHHGFPGSTFEVSRLQRLDGGAGAARSSRAMTLGYEAFVNYLAMGIKEGIGLKNRN